MACDQKIKLQNDVRDRELTERHTSFIFYNFKENLKNNKLCLGTLHHTQVEQEEIF